MIERYLRRIAKDTAVYWGSPTLRDDGTNQYAAPIEIKCLWKEGFISDPDRDIVSISIKAQIYVFRDLDQGGILWKGTLAQLSVQEKQDPREIEDAYEINIFKKIPSLYIRGEFNRYAIIAPEIARIPPGIER